MEFHFMALYQTTFDLTHGISTWQQPLLIGAGLMVVGMIITGLSTWLVVNRFLSMRLDDLY
jgi:hypothetical protein